ncbi:MAG: hypothetical protein JKY96_09415 [Phycisphaerales bacterium]|nr:hypothetical protein [Phycisphaerales bacterium]
MGKKKKKNDSPASAPGNGDYLADVPTKVISGSMGLVAFALTAGIGIWAGNSAMVTLTRALVACAICAFVGRILGMMGEVCVKEFVNNYKADRPSPLLPEELQQLERERAAHGQVVDEMRKKAA